MHFTVGNHFLIARKVQFSLEIGFLLLGKCISFSKTTFLLLGKRNSAWIEVSCCSESAFHSRKSLSYCSESEIRLGLRFLAAGKVQFTLENHFLIARKVKISLDWGFLLLGKYKSLLFEVLFLSESRNSLAWRFRADLEALFSFYFACLFVW